MTQRYVSPYSWGSEWRPVDFQDIQDDIKHINVAGCSVRTEMEKIMEFGKQIDRHNIYKWIFFLLLESVVLAFYSYKSY